MEQPKTNVAKRSGYVNQQVAINRGWITTNEAAQIVGVSSQTVINWSKKGFFKVDRIRAGRRQIPISSFVAFLRGEKIVPPSWLDEKINMETV